MKLHWISTLGILVAAGGWAWLVFGAGVQTSYGAAQVFNLQLAALGEQTCNLGYALLIAGTIVSGFDWLKPKGDDPVDSNEGGEWDEGDAEEEFDAEQPIR